jgi:hypothetical protein
MQRATTDTTGLPELSASIVPSLAEYLHPSAPHSLLNLGSPGNRKAITQLAGLAGLAAVVAGVNKYKSGKDEEARALAAEKARQAQIAAELLALEQEKSKRNKLLLSAAAATTGLGLGAYGYNKYKK